MERQAGLNGARHIGGSGALRDRSIRDPAGVPPVVDGHSSGDDGGPAEQVLGIYKLRLGGKGPSRRLLDDLVPVGWLDPSLAEPTIKLASNFGPDGFQPHREKLGNQLALRPWKSEISRFLLRRVFVNRVQRRSPSLRARLLVGAAFLPLLTVSSQLATSHPAGATQYCVDAYPQPDLGATACTP
jgi:hypothetical protein